MQRTLIAQAEHQDNVRCELYVDSAYESDDTLAEAKHQGRELIGPARPRRAIQTKASSTRQSLRSIPSSARRSAQRGIPADNAV